MTLGNLSAGQPHSYRPIEPAGSFGEAGEERLAKQETFSAWRYCPKPQFPSLIPAVEYDPPPEYRPLVPVPVEHSNELFA
jgi:hypothetical protein